MKRRQGCHRSDQVWLYAPSRAGMASRALEGACAASPSRCSSIKKGRVDELDAMLSNAVLAHQNGRLDEALKILEGLFEQIDSGALQLAGNHFGTMFEWSLLVEEYLPARHALERTRDKQVLRLRDGHENFGGGNERPRSRFHVIVEMNDILGDKRSTYELFVHLTSFRPALARQEAFLALPAVVAVGDFVLAERYLPDPLAWLDDLNRLADEFPLFPPLHVAPRMGAELSNFMGEVILRDAVLRGLGRESEAESLRDAALAGLATDDMRELGIREIAVPGTIIREITSHHIDLEESKRLKD